MLCVPTFFPETGGATFLFRKFNEDLTRVQWRGRWKSYKMLETYVQELGASEIWIRFPQKIRDRVKVLGDLFLRLLHVACDARLPDTPAAMHPSPPAREG